MAEPAPPGGVAQVRLEVTEPKPISTGGGRTRMPRGTSSLAGIALMSPGGDAAGVALVEGLDVTLWIVSPSAAWGTDDDYPLVTLTGHVRTDVQVGSTWPIALDRLKLFDGSGNRYPTDVKPGTLVIGRGVSISNVIPGSARVPAGGVVIVRGRNFTRGTRIRFDEVDLASVTYVDSTRMDVVVADPVVMHGLEIKAENPDPNRSRTVYYSYQRTTDPEPSSNDLLAATYPLFTAVSGTRGRLPFPKPTASSAFGVAVQNIGKADAAVALRLESATGTVLSTTDLAVPANTRAVRDVAELFGFPCDRKCVVTFAATRPVQVLGVAADMAARTVRPVLLR